ncbi:MAG: LamG domain-containing protein [bacterium]|nr:LamG domain-containing protein [bacterium]
MQCTLGTGNDAGQWADCGRPGNALFITSLAVCEGALYAGTCEPDAGQSGHVYRYDEGAWVDCGSPDASNSVYALAVLDGVLHAGTGRYKTSGSALPDSPNQHPGGRVFRYANGAWVDCGRLGGEDSEADTVGAMAVFNGHLYATPMYHKGVYRYDGGTTWAFCGVPTGDIPGPMFGAEAGEETPGCRLISLTVHDGHLYAAGNGRDQGIFRYDGGEAWTNVGKPAGVDQVYSFMQYRGRLYTGTWPKAEVFRWDGGDTWTSCGCLADELEVMAMMTYAGELYAGSLPLAAVYRYDGRDGWEYSERLDHTPDMKYRRVWSMAVYEGKLFCGTLPSGHVHAFDAGACITHDHELQPGWRHIAAVRRGNALRLFVDGRLVAARDIPADLDAVTEGPLFVGFGPHDYFNGRMRDLRIYGQALSDADVSALHADRPKGIE